MRNVTYPTINISTSMLIKYHLRRLATIQRATVKVQAAIYEVRSKMRWSTWNWTIS